MEQIVQIDGSLHEGGGQMIRSSLALSIILNKQFTIHSIRKNRPNPGINNQLRAIFAAFTQKIPKVSQSQVHFYPKFLQPTVIKATTAASCTLMLQCLLPVCAILKYQKQVRLEGGTDVSKSPALESVKEGLTPLLNRMGVFLQIGQIKRGFYPIGKGYFDFKVKTGLNIKPIIIKELSPPQRVIITYYIKDKKVPGSSKQFQKDIKKLLHQGFGQHIKFQMEVKVQKVFNTKDQYGIGCLILGQNLVWDLGTVGQPITEQKIIDRLYKHLETKPCLDEYHQDQLLLLMSLAAGKSEIKIGQQLSLHAESLMYVINQFIPDVKFTHEDGILSVEGIGIQLKQFDYQ